MKKVRRIGARWHSRKVVTCLTIVLVVGIIIFLKGIYTEVAKFTVESVWQRSSIIGISIVIAIYILICIEIITIQQVKVSHIDIEQKICVKGKQKIYYKNVYYTQSLLQKIFHLTNVYFVNESEEIVIKDVEKKVAVYVEAIKLKGK